MNGRMDGWMDGWMDGSIISSVMDAGSREKTCEIALAGQRAISPVAAPQHAAW